jgi:hypothetical protein
MDGVKAQTDNALAPLCYKGESLRHVCPCIEQHGNHMTPLFVCRNVQRDSMLCHHIDIRAAIKQLLHAILEITFDSMMESGKIGNV